MIAVLSGLVLPSPHLPVLIVQKCLHGLVSELFSTHKPFLHRPNMSLLLLYCYFYGSFSLVPPTLTFTTGTCPAIYTTMVNLDLFQSRVNCYLSCISPQTSLFILHQTITLYFECEWVFVFCEH